MRSVSSTVLVAITVALQAAGVRPGDEVIVPPYTFIATAPAALAYGAIPVFVDVEADTLLLYPEKVALAITPRTKAIVPVHLAGAATARQSREGGYETHESTLYFGMASSFDAAVESVVKQALQNLLSRSKNF